MANIKNFNPSLLSIDQVSFKGADCVIYDIEYFKIFDNKNYLYPVSNDVDEYIEENNEDEHLIFASTSKNKNTLENYTELWDEVQDQIELISGNNPIEYKNDFMKIKFESGDEINIPVFAIILTSIFQESNTYYPQAFFT